MPTIKTKGAMHDTLTGYDFEVDAPLRPLKAIRGKCLECCCNNSAEVRRCHITDCVLWPYRLGKNPRRAGMGPKEPPFLRSTHNSGAHSAITAGR